ncbi:hypothetical protein NE235_06765 [Actinoallomurus spadix]|nr:hypothetical protein [Actinoallomurus spadix]MCO5985808.1 hypothetical protein [Actinoallomurus spadix]
MMTERAADLGLLQRSADPVGRGEDALAGTPVCDVVRELGGDGRDGQSR